MPHKSNPKGVEALKKIIKIARKLREKDPNKEWKDCIKEASEEYKKKHPKSTKKTTKKKQTKKKH
jgi:hypothetical protein